MKTLLALDLSTSCTGYAFFDEKGKLTKYGILKPKVPLITKMKYPEAQLAKIKDMSSKVRDIVTETNPELIIIEEINRGINRIAQKSLDALHFFVLDYLNMIDPKWLKEVIYIDSNGKEGWRGGLGLKLSEEDKLFNKEARVSGQKRLVVDWKTLSQRFVNKQYKLNLNVKENSGDADIADAIALGAYYLSK